MIVYKSKYKKNPTLNKDLLTTTYPLSEVERVIDDSNLTTPQKLNYTYLLYYHTKQGHDINDNQLLTLSTIITSLTQPFNYSKNQIPYTFQPLPQHINQLINSLLNQKYRLNFSLSLTLQTN